jgi:hypothetical protein
VAGEFLGAPVEDQDDRDPARRFTRTLVMSMPRHCRGAVRRGLLRLGVPVPVGQVVGWTNYPLA